jgi:hypothetical protein
MASCTCCDACWIHGKRPGRIHFREMEQWRDGAYDHHDALNDLVDAINETPESVPWLSETAVTMLDKARALLAEDTLGSLIKR